MPRVPSKLVPGDERHCQPQGADVADAESQIERPSFTSLDGLDSATEEEATAHPREMWTHQTLPLERFADVSCLVRDTPPSQVAVSSLLKSLRLILRPHRSGVR